jgi:prolipoprotein diacylglyceryltransferase
MSDDLISIHFHFKTLNIAAKRMATANCFNFNPSLLPSEAWNDEARVYEPIHTKMHQAPSLLYSSVFAGIASMLILVWMRHSVLHFER